MANTGVMRLGYVHIQVTDLAEARDHYVNTLGLYPTKEDTGKVYLKGWDEFDHHSILLEEGGVGVTKFGFKVRQSSDLDEFERKAQSFGDVEVERFGAGENAEVGDGVRFTMANGHVIELYDEMTQLGVEVGTHNPDAFPLHLRGVGAPALDHALMSCGDVAEMENFFTQVLGFYPCERMVASTDDDAPLVATWLSCGNQNHNLAWVTGPNAGLHHISFRLKDWMAVTAAADLFLHTDVPLDLVPTRHGITRGETTYFFDPSGNRNETFCGGYEMYPDRPVVTWTFDQLGKGLDYYRREVSPTFLSVFT